MYVGSCVCLMTCCVVGSFLRYIPFEYMQNSNRVPFNRFFSFFVSFFLIPCFPYTFTYYHIWFHMSSRANLLFKQNHMHNAHIYVHYKHSTAQQINKYSHTICFILVSVILTVGWSNRWQVSTSQASIIFFIKIIPF